MSASTLLFVTGSRGRWRTSTGVVTRLRDSASDFDAGLSQEYMSPIPVFPLSSAVTCYCDGGDSTRSRGPIHFNRHFTHFVYQQLWACCPASLITVVSQGLSFRWRAAARLPLYLLTNCLAYQCQSSASRRFNVWRCKGNTFIFYLQAFSQKSFGI